jgi:hypothetical protein
VLVSVSVNVLIAKTCLAARVDGRAAPIWATWNEPYPSGAVGLSSASNVIGEAFATWADAFSWYWFGHISR